MKIEGEKSLSYHESFSPSPKCKGREEDFQVFCEGLPQGRKVATAEGSTATAGVTTSLVAVGVSGAAAVTSTWVDTGSVKGSLSGSVGASCDQRLMVSLLSLPHLLLLL